MMRSLYSGVAGLKTHQTKMDVIGNNIANVNTVGFKASSVVFKDVLYQTTEAATASSDTSGGTKAKQIGLGTGVATVSVSQTSGSAQSTNNPYDLMINGSSFFVVSRGGVNYFTKVGAFNTDDAGNLVTGSGDFVMGWQVDPDDPTQIKRDTVSKLRPEAVENQSASPEMTSKTYMSGNIVQTDARLAEGVPTTVSIYDNLGYSYTVKFNITQSTTDPSAYELSVESIKDENNVDIIHDSADGKTKALYECSLSAKTIKFDKDSGAFVGMDGQDGVLSTALKITPKDGSKTGNVFQDSTQDPPVESIEVDCSSLHMYASKGGECNVETHRGSTQSAALGAGRKVGKLTDVSIDTQGKIYGVYDNGVNKLLGQIAVANFVNPAGLEAVGGNLYKETKASGEFDGIGMTIGAAGETMTQGVLEMSNVDLSQEFTEMIVTQRGFQANSRIITVSDTLIEELVNLKR
ncbi:MAG: flagellar hook protein FlgE [Eubacteriales bacterium]|nr:flagellar hook protein FlgE [Eubacteriales bacterium]